ncbi:MAG: ABC-F type ribosomal protection protein [Eubacteriales bacterium]|nr:ABC-F type ribosomal protection protein [Eubacteriales bacterium]
MLLRADNLEKEYGICQLFKIERLVIEDGARIGLIGRNGAGKSTLLGILSGSIKPDEGSVKRYCDIACIRQDSATQSKADEQYISRMDLKGSALKSGGEQMRYAIASAFSIGAPLLFADEPTTNLDMDGIMKLEKMLCGYRGAVVLVSHDRQLLDNVCNEIWEIENGSIRVFKGSYSQWVCQKEQERNYQKFEYEQYRKEVQRLNKAAAAAEAEGKNMKKPPRRMGSSEWMLYKGIASDQQKSVSNRGRAIKSRMSHLEKKEKPSELPNVSMTGMHIKKIKAKCTARITDMTVKYGNKAVLEHAELSVMTGKKTFITGENGAGKSTLLNALMQKRPETYITEDAKIGYFSQNLAGLQDNKSVLENVLYEAVEAEHICRAVLANLYMSKEDLNKDVKVLSGGERVKTALAKLLVSGSNFLILDEPTNHCDIYTMEGLEKMLSEYEGTLLAVSHDRRLVHRLADVVYEIKNGIIYKK